MRNSSSSRGMSQMRTEQSSLVEQLALARKERLERTKHRGQSQQLTGTTSERVRADGEVRLTFLRSHTYHDMHAPTHTAHIITHTHTHTHTQHTHTQHI